MKEFDKSELKFLHWLLENYLLEYTGYGKDLTMLNLALKIFHIIEEELK